MTLPTSATSPVSIEDLDLPYLDLQSEAFLSDPHAVLRGLGSSGVPFARSVRGVEVLSYPLVWALLSHRGADTPDDHGLAEIDGAERLASFRHDGLLLDMEREQHDRVRRVVIRPFSGNRIESLRAEMRRIATRLIDDFPDTASCEIVSQFTHRYSIEVLCDLLGVPVDDIAQFESGTLDLRLMGSIPLEPMLARVDRALETLWDYSLALLTERRRHPRDDFATELVQSYDAEQTMTEEQLVWSIANLLFAGHDTTRYQLASCIRALAEHERAWQRVGEAPELVPAAVDEASRYYPVVQALTRVAHEDIVAGEWLFPGGTVLSLNMLAASRDPAVFESPDDFLLPRPGETYQAVYGRGSHRCVGHALARTEMIEALTVLTARFPGAEILGEVPMHPASSRMGGPEALHVRLGA